MVWRRRYKVVEKGGGVGEVVQVAVRDVGVNAGENTPPLYITSLMDTSRRNKAFDGTGCSRDGSPCYACAHYQDRIVQLEAQLEFMEKQMHVNNILNAMMNSLATQHNLSQGSALPSTKSTGGSRTPSSRRHRKQQQQQREEERQRSESKDEGDEHPTLLEMMQEELRRQDLLHALMNLLERPTPVEAARSAERLVPEHVKLLRKGVPEH
ncbi:uncharacterized protein TM35_000252270 [Trypanosoma theileri]|uniref:Uncharacterized protein n=1 Tax=Trypanosoma theileri TaxID=67003 RepID=A0A1X0NQR0_9TRYP|nr:uncharacterized protein TM35_000252270 [Trypanosoma theileri]ORC86931.1 hypothetical protein TM35_000252270 [Trypanosoma theileri]